MDIYSFSLLSWQVFAIALVAGLAHGVSGFGFPLISTPVVALFTDVRTAVILTLLPNIVVN
ncbi:MAG: sulfite exporter TauE/SafE family protein, partial [Pseudomonadota bacterium]